ncbi:unnamed protein product [Phaeothamnion confervicola]
MAATVAAADAAYVAEDYPSAITLYGKVIEAEPSSHLPYLNRCAALLKLRRAAEALEDAEAALRLEPECELALYRKGLACFELERFVPARDAFRSGQQRYAAASEHDPRRYPTWLRKCEAEIGLSDTEVSETADPAAKPAAVAANRPAPQLKAAAAAAPPSTHLQTRFQYYQSSEKLTVGILVKGVKAEEATVEVEPRRVRLWSGGKESPTLLFDKLLHDEVVPAECKTRFLASKVEIVLKKKSPFEWPDLGALPPGPGAAPASAPARAPSSSPAAAASSTDGAAATKEKKPRPYSSHRDWDTIEKEVERELSSEKPGESERNENDRGGSGGAEWLPCDCRWCFRAMLSAAQ